MHLHHNLQRNKKGIGTVFGMVFFLLIVMLVFASFMIILNQNTGLEQVAVKAKQMDLDRYTELETISIMNPEVAVLNNTVYVSCSVTNNGTLTATLVRFWIEDVTNHTIGNTIAASSIYSTVLQPGSSTYYFNSAKVANASSSDQFIFWFVTARGNIISAYPDINQFNGITNSGTFPGVTDITSTYNGEHYAPLQLSLTTTKPNQLIYVVVSYDDGNTLYPPTSTPSLTWTLRGQCPATDRYSNGDSILKTFYAIKPTTGLLTINIQSTADELQDYYCSALAFAISDVNTASPFDGSAQTFIGQSTTPQDTITTQNSNDLIIGAVGVDSLNPAITPGTGFAEIMHVQSSYGASGEADSMPRSVWGEWSITAAPKNNLPVTCSFTPSRAWAIVVDAVNLLVIPPTAPVSLSPNSGPIGQPVTVSGQGFANNSQLIATFDGSKIPFGYTTDGSGNIPPGATFTVPQGSTAGNKTVTIIDSKFNYASVNFTVTTPNITVSPQNGPVGTTVTVTGSNFITNSIMTIEFDGNSIATNPSTITADAAGGFSTTFVASGTAGAKQVLASDGVNSVYATFTIIPNIVIIPTQGPHGTSVTASGTGYSANSNINLVFGVVPISATPAIMTDISGSFSNVMFTVPNSVTGSQAVTATDSNGFSDFATFTVVTSSISISPSSGVVGTSIAVSGSNFLPNSPLTVTLDGVTVATSTSTGSGALPSGVTFNVPASTFGGHVVMVTDGYGNYATYTFSVTTSVSLSLATGPVGTPVTVSGRGFAGSSTVTATFGGSAVTLSGVTSTDSFGSLSGAIFTIPASTVGSKSVVITDASSHFGSATFTVVTRSLSLSPTSGPNGTLVTVTGSNFVPNYVIAFKFDSSVLSTSPSTVTSSGTGSFSCTFAVPNSVVGSHTVYASDTVSNAASATFTVAASSISLSPSSGAIGVTVTVSGSNFLSTSPLTVTYDGVTVDTSTSTGSGALPSGVTFIVPASAFGGHVVMVTDGYGNYATATFTMNVASISLSPATGPVGTSVTVSGQGFAASSAITATFGGSAVTLSGVTSTGSSGSFSGATFTVPSSSAGSKSVVITDASSHFGSATFTITTPSISLNPANGDVGTVVTVTGSNFIANSIIIIKFDSSTQSTTPSTVTATGTGSFSATFTVPNSVYGSHTVSGTDGVNSASATFTVSPIITTKSAVASSLSLQYSVTQPNSFVVIVVTGGYYSLTSVTPPAGFTQQEWLTGSDGYESAYIAVNTAQATGSYTVSTAASHSGTGISIAVYVFAPGTYSYTHGNGGGSTSASLTLTAGANYYIFGGSDGNGAMSLSTSNIDVQDSSNYSAIGHQTTQTASVSSSQARIIIVGISITRTG
jgi:hypothetical protein